MEYLSLDALKMGTEPITQATKKQILWGALADKYTRSSLQ